MHAILFNQTTGEVTAASDKRAGCQAIIQK